MKKKFLLVILLLVLHVIAFAQTQYDYYEGKDAYGGVDTAITGIKIFGIIVLALVVVLVIAAIYGYFAGWFKKEKKPLEFAHPDKTTQKPNLNSTKDISPNVDENKHSLKEKHSEIITIVGNVIEGNLTQKDGSKRNEWYWYDISSIKHNLKNDITRVLGCPISCEGSSWYLADHLDENDLLTDTMRPYTAHMELRITEAFDPSKLHLAKITGFDKLYDGTIIYYNGEAQMQRVIEEKDAVALLSKVSSTKSQEQEVQKS